MAVKETDSIIGSARGRPDQAIAYAQSQGAKRIDEVDSYINEAYRLGAMTGIDPAIAVAQSSHETDIWRSHFWIERLNGAGVGITGDPAQNAVSVYWLSGADFAQSQFAHLLLYATGTIDRAGLTPDDDPRYRAYVAAYGTKPVATTIDALAGKWAADTDYAAGIVRHAAAIFGNVPDQSTTPIPNPGGETPPMADLNMSKGLIPLPDHDEHYIDVWQRDQSIGCRGFDMLGNRPATPKFLVLHKSQNEPWQSNTGWFEATCCPALTDWEVVASTGKMTRYVRRGNAPSGWANGVVSAPYGDALAWLNQHNWDLNSVNRDGEAIEITGWFPSSPVTQDTPVSDVAWKNLAQWIASRAHDYQIPWDEFPLIKKEGNRSYLTTHNEWTAGTGKTCPGPLVTAYIPTLIERARAIMKAAQTGSTKPKPKPPVYAAPDVPDWMLADIKAGFPSDHTHNGVKVYAALRQYEATKATKRRQSASIDSEIVGPPLKVRERFTGWYFSKSPDGKHNWIWTPYGTRVDAAALTPRISIRTA